MKKEVNIQLKEIIYSIEEMKKSLDILDLSKDK